MPLLLPPVRLASPSSLSLARPLAQKQVFTVLSPNLLQATDYWSVGRVLDASPKVRRGRALLRPAVIKTTFILADLLALL